MHTRLHNKHMFQAKFEIAKESETDTACTSFRGRMIDSDVDRMIDSGVESDSFKLSNWEHLKLDSESSD